MNKYKCKKCGKTKLEKEFSKHSQCKLGIDLSACKECKRSAHDWTKVPLEKRIYNRIRSRATKKGMDFNLELSDIILPTECPVFKKPFIYGDKDWTYSVDRIKNDLGYVKGNIQIMSNRANRLKGDFTSSELLMMASHIGACK